MKSVSVISIPEWAINVIFSAEHMDDKHILNVKSGSEWWFTNQRAYLTEKNPNVIFLSPQKTPCPRFLISVATI